MGQSLFSCGRILWLAGILQGFLAKLNNSTQMKGFERESDMPRLFLDWKDDLYPSCPL